MSRKEDSSSVGAENCFIFFFLVLLFCYPKGGILLLSFPSSQRSHEERLSPREEARAPGSCPSAPEATGFLMCRSPKRLWTSAEVSHIEGTSD